MKPVILSALALGTLVGAGPGPSGNGQAPPSDPARAIEFRLQKLDGGQSETAALSDVNNDGALDIISSESWYEAPRWTKRPIRAIPFTSNYVDNFSDLPIDVNGDGFVDVVQIGYFARRLVWMQNPGKAGGAWTEQLIDAVGPTEFAFLVDLDNDGRARELLPQFTSAAQAPLCWYEIRNGTWVKHVIAAQSYGHGIGAGDLNHDGRTDVLTPVGWLEAPADVRAPGPWPFHRTEWLQPAIAIGRPPVSAGAPVAPVPPGPPEPPVRVECGFMHVLDLNGDGRHDVLTTMAHSYGVLWFEQGAAGRWTPHLVDNSWSRAHASALVDLNRDGRRDFVTGTRLMGRNAAETEPLAMYWYEYRPGGAVTWVRHQVSAGGDAGGGLQIAIGDIGSDGDADIVSGGKSGLFLFERGPAR